MFREVRGQHEATGLIQQLRLLPLTFKFGKIPCDEDHVKGLIEEDPNHGGINRRFDIELGFGEFSARDVVFPLHLRPNTSTPLGSSSLCPIFGPSSSLFWSDYVGRVWMKKVHGQTISVQSLPWQFVIPLSVVFYPWRQARAYQRVYFASLTAVLKSSRIQVCTSLNLLRWALRLQWTVLAVTKLQGPTFPLFYFSWR